MSTDEVQAHYHNVVHCDPVHRTIELRSKTTDTNNSNSNSAAMKSLTFDQVFGVHSTQPDIFHQVARPIIDNVLKGYNGTIFAYGQTGSGKTFTMEGIANKPELRGIIPNAFAHIFGHIKKQEGDQNFLVRVSYFEIYKEQIRDLLAKKPADRNSTAGLEVKEDKERGVYVKGLVEQVVHSADDLDKIMALGKKSRMTAATKMNLTSSRSHAIFTITIERSERRPDGRLHICVGKLNLVDLAGSERQSKTEATDERLKEASKINHGLSTLGNVIAALTDGKSSHIPYRNSKLTRILQDSLGGNSKTVMCANVGPASYNLDETTNTLRYATRAKFIKNVAKINEDPKDAVLRRMEEEIQQLRKLLSDSPGGAAEGDQGNSVERRKLQEERRVKQEARKKQLQQMQSEIEQQKHELTRNNLMSEKERQKLLRDIEAKEAELEQTEKDRQIWLEKLRKLEKTVIIGGENLLDKAEEQERFLEESKLELEVRRKKEEELRRTLVSKKTERSQIQEKFQSLQETASVKSLEAGRLKAQLVALKTEIRELREDNLRRKEDAAVSMKETEKNIRLYQKIMDRFLPQEMQTLIEKNCTYNPEIGEWEVSCLAFTGPMMTQPAENGGEANHHKNKNGDKSLGYADALKLMEKQHSKRHRDWERVFRSYGDYLPN